MKKEERRKTKLNWIVNDPMEKKRVKIQVRNE
jgi:hypothetical protein